VVIRILTHAELDARLDVAAADLESYDRVLRDLVDEVDAEDRPLEIADPQAWRREDVQDDPRSMLAVEDQFRAEVEAIQIQDREDEARRLFEAAGFGPDNLPKLELRYNTSATHRKIALAAQEMWKDVLGLDVELINEEFRVLVANMRAMQITQLFRLSWNADVNDASSFLTLFESGNQSNMFGFADGNFDRLMNDAARQVDPVRRRLHLEEAERELLAAHVVIPLYYPVSKHLVRSTVGGWQDNVLDYHYSQDLYFAEP
jgi:ABC-type oligopeptide transport system substrate-binding subunit